MFKSAMMLPFENPFAEAPMGEAEIARVVAVIRKHHGSDAVAYVDRCMSEAIEPVERDNWSVIRARLLEG